MVRRIGFGALLGTAVGVAALILGAIQNWTALRSGDKLSLRVLVRDDFGPAGAFYKSVGALSILLAVLAVLALLDRTGWLSRLVGLAAVAVAVLFAIEAYRHFGKSAYDSVHGVRPGFWLELIAGLALFTTAGARRTRRAHRARPGTDIGAADDDAARRGAAIDTGARTDTGVQDDDRVLADTGDNGGRDGRGVRVGTAAESTAADSTAADSDRVEPGRADSDGRDSTSAEEDANADTLVRPRS